MLTVNAFLERAVDSATSSSPVRTTHKRQRRYGRRARARPVKLVPNTSDDDQANTGGMYARRSDYSESISAESSSPIFTKPAQVSGSGRARKSFTTRIAQAAVLAHVDRGISEHPNGPGMNTAEKASSLHLVYFAPESPSPPAKRQRRTALVDPRKLPFFESTFSTNINSTPLRLPCTPLSKLMLTQHDIGKLSSTRKTTMPMSPSKSSLPRSEVANRTLQTTECRPLQFVPYEGQTPSRCRSSNEYALSFTRQLLGY